MEVIKGYTLTRDEADACLELVQKMREERERKRMLAFHQQQIEDLVIATIDAIGLDETKRIIRRVNHDLRFKCEGSAD